MYKNYFKRLHQWLYIIEKQKEEETIHLKFCLDDRGQIC